MALFTSSPHRMNHDLGPARAGAVRGPAPSGMARGPAPPGARGPSGGTGRPAAPLPALAAVLAALALALPALGGCRDEAVDRHGAEQKLLDWYIEDYRRVPGVTASEIAAIEELKARGRSLSFGTFRSGEAFESRQGVKAGFLVKLAEALSGMLGVPIEHRFESRTALYPALVDGSLDLACEVAGGDGLFMTSPVFERQVKVWWRAGGPAPPAAAPPALARPAPPPAAGAPMPPASSPGAEAGAAADGPPARYGFLEGALVADSVLAATAQPVETVLARDHDQAAAMLRDGVIDAFFDGTGYPRLFGGGDGLGVSDLYPPVGTPLSLATADPALAPVISVVQKFLDAGGLGLLFEIYSVAADENRRIFFEDGLDGAQAGLLASLRAKGTPIRVAAGSGGYPATFYNRREGRFEGIAHDVLGDLSKVTGLRFEVANEPGVPNRDLAAMVLGGRADLMANLNYQDTVSAAFALSRRPHNHDRYALLTSFGHADVELSQLAYEIVGLIEGDKNSEAYLAWFPQSRNHVTHPDLASALEALREGRIDFLMASENLLLNLGNYHEDPSWKIALAFNQDLPHGLAFRPEDAALRDLLDSGLAYVDAKQIGARWRSRLFDYRHKLLAAAAPYVITLCGLLLASVTGLVLSNARNRRLNRSLEGRVSARTAQLEAAKEDLNREKTLLSSIVDSCPVGLVISRDGIIKFINPFAGRFLGRGEGGTLKGCFGDDSVRRDMLATLADGGSVSWWPARIRRADRAIRETLLNAFTGDYHGETCHVCWMNDVTELRDNERALALARDLAEESARAKSAFLANMSHEIRTPMNAIVGLTRLALGAGPSGALREYLEKTEAAARSLLGIINDILDFSKIEAGKLQMESIAFRLDEVLEGAVGLFAFKAAEQGLELLLRIDPGTSVSLVGDPLRLGQVLNNLMGNAMKFTECGSVELLADQLEAGVDTVTLRFRIRDTGIGLSSEQTGRLFTAFNQADSSFTRRYGGTGLGLAISKSLVELMDGQITVESAPGAGSTFGFTARFGLQDDLAYSVPRPFLIGRRALAAGDRPLALAALAEDLAHLGLETAAAASGPEALARMVEAARAGRPFDLCVLGHLAEPMEGPDLARAAAAALGPDLAPVMVMCAETGGDPDPEAFRAAGAAAVVAAPVTAGSLAAALAEALDVPVGDPLRSARRPAGGVDPAAAARLKGSRVLLAEDNEVNQLVASRLLLNAGIEVDVARNGAQAVDMVKAGDYDLVLMDIQMPVMDGLAATRAIRAMPGRSDLPIVAMTAHAMSGDREQSLEAGMNDHVTKPINLDELFGALDRWIGDMPG